MEQADQRSRQAVAEQSDSGPARTRLDVQEHYGDGWVAGRDCADPQRALPWGRDVLWPALRLLGENWPWRGRFAESDLPVLRCFLLYAGGKTWHRSHRKIRDRLWIGAEDWYRPAQRSERRDAVGRMEDPQFQAEVVRGRDDFGGHRPGQGGDHSGAIDARDRRHFDGWAHGCAARD